MYARKAIRYIASLLRNRQMNISLIAGNPLELIYNHMVMNKDKIGQSAAKPLMRKVQRLVARRTLQVEWKWEIP